MTTDMSPAVSPLASSAETAHVTNTAPTPDLHPTFSLPAKPQPNPHSDANTAGNPSPPLPPLRRHSSALHSVARSIEDILHNVSATFREAYTDLGADLDKEHRPDADMEDRATHEIYKTQSRQSRTTEGGAAGQSGTAVGPCSVARTRREGGEGRGEGRSKVTTRTGEVIDLDSTKSPKSPESPESAPSRVPAPPTVQETQMGRTETLVSAGDSVLTTEHLGEHEDSTVSVLVADDGQEAEAREGTDAHHSEHLHALHASTENFKAEIAARVHLWKMEVKELLAKARKEHEAAEGVAAGAGESGSGGADAGQEKPRRKFSFRRSSSHGAPAPQAVSDATGAEAAVDDAPVPGQVMSRQD